MIQEQISNFKVEPMLIARQEKTAKKNYKISLWLKLISMHQENHNFKEIDRIISQEMHQNFVLLESFWLELIKQKIGRQQLERQDLDIMMLALEDGPYEKVAHQLANIAIQLYQKDKKKLNLCLSILEKIINKFSYDKSKGSSFYKFLRQVYSLSGNKSKIRDSFQREIKEYFNNFDVCYDEYLLWQTEQTHKIRIQTIYQASAKLWQQERIAFDEQTTSKLNIKRSLYNLQLKNVIDDKEYLQWVQQLVTSKEQLYFLRRMVISYKKLIGQYLIKCQDYYNEDEETLIKIYKSCIRMSQNSLEIQRRYVHYLVRRINIHFFTDSLQKGYLETWSEKVAYFRQEINNLIVKERKLITPGQQLSIFNDYYCLWIQIQSKIIKDKDMTCKLYQNLIKESQLAPFSDYAKTLVDFGLFKDAKNVLKRGLQQGHVSGKDFQLFLGLYSTIKDQVQIHQEQQKAINLQNSKYLENNKQTGQKKNEQKSIKNDGLEKTQFSVQVVENRGPKRQRPALDEVQLKIEEATRNKMHVDGQHTVFLKGINPQWSETEVLQIIQLKDKVSQVRMIQKNKIRMSYCYIQFKDKQSAEEQIKINKSGLHLYISKPPSQYDQSKTLYISGLPATATEAKIRELFEANNEHIKEIRMKLERDKNFAYIDFQLQQMKEKALKQLGNNHLIDGKKVFLQECDSNRKKNKKFLKVVFLKNLSFKTKDQDITAFFKNRNLAKILIVKDQHGKPKGFAYLKFQNYIDYQEALDLRKGTIHGRQFLILKSDRQISQQNFANSHSNSKAKDTDQKEERPRSFKKTKEPFQERQKTGKPAQKNNDYFKNLFK